MARRPKPVYTPIDPAPADLSREEAFADGAVSVREAAKFLGIGRSKMYDLVKAGRVPACKLDGQIAVARRALVLFLAQCPAVCPTA